MSKVAIYRSLLAKDIETNQNCLESKALFSDEILASLINCQFGRSIAMNVGVKPHWKKIQW